MQESGITKVMPRKIEISHRTIVFTLLFLVLIWFLYFIKDIIMQFFLALIITVILNPLVTNLSRHKIPRGLSVLVVYIFLLIFLSALFAVLVPALVEQTTSLVNGLPLVLDQIGVPLYLSEEVIKEVLAQLGNLPGQIVRVGLSIFSNALSVILVLIFAFYLLISKERIDEQLGTFLGEGKEKQLVRLVDELELKLGGWARGQLTLMVLVGLATYVGLTILGIPYVLPLSILAGLLEVVPIIGPIFAAVPAAVIGFGISPVTGLATVALSFLVQQVENYVFVPKIMQRSTGVNPIVTLLALTIGFRMAGVAGAMISIPVVITLQIFIREFAVKK